MGYLPVFVVDYGVDLNICAFYGCLLSRKQYVCATGYAIYGNYYESRLFTSIYLVESRRVSSAFAQGKGEFTMKVTCGDVIVVFHRM